MLYKPASRRAARCYKGTKLRHRWPDDEQGFSGGFYEAEVINVPQSPVKGDEDGIYLTLQCKGFFVQNMEIYPSDSPVGTSKKGVNNLTLQC